MAHRTRLKYLPPLEGERLELYKSMPKFKTTGMVVSLFYVDNPRHRDEYEAQWREWAKGRPKRLWPEWLGRWADQKAHTPRAKP